MSQPKTSRFQQSGAGAVPKFQRFQALRAFRCSGILRFHSFKPFIAAFIRDAIASIAWAASPWPGGLTLHPPATIRLRVLQETAELRWNAKLERLCRLFIYTAPLLGTNFSAMPLLHQRLPVGGGPSLKTWP